MSKVLVRSAVSNINSISFVSTNQVFSHATKVFIFDDDAAFALLQSSVHTAWLEKYASTMRTDVRYTPETCFAPFPFSDLTNAMRRTGERYDQHRRMVMSDRQEGMTKTYKRLFASDETSADIQKLRKLHVEMDNAVAAAYGWTDLDFGHGFHQAKRGIRFTISESARREVLARLLKLNHERYAEEVAHGLHDKGKKKASRGRATKKRKSNGPGLFD
jgi:hypothetical protein